MMIHSDFVLQGRTTAMDSDMGAGDGVLGLLTEVGGNDEKENPDDWQH